MNQNDENEARMGDSFEHPTSEGAAPQGFRFMDVVDDGGQVRPWHGAWRFDGSQDQLHTALMPFNLLLRLYWALVVFVKLGGKAVAADPRQAFMDGYQAAVRDHPLMLQEWQDRLERQEQALVEFSRELDERRKAQLEANRVMRSAPPA